MDKIFKENEFVSGIVKNTGKNFGFLITNKGDLFIPPMEFQKVFIGDNASGRVFYNNGKPQATIEFVNKNKYSEYIGVFKVTDKGTFVVPEEKNKHNIHHWLRIPKSKRKKASDGDIVKVEVIEYPIVNKKPKGAIKKVIGKPDSPNFEANYVFEEKNIPIYFSNDVVDKASEYDEDFINRKLAKRKNMVMAPFVTIDGENTKDVDDALFCKKTSNGWKLWVAISDVTEFVKEGDVIDKDAYERTSSVYTPLRYVAMLPENLSSNLCSLEPNLTRLAFICHIELSEEGEILKSDFFEGAIRSKARISYNELEDYMMGNESLEYGDHIVKNIDNLCELHRVLNEYRRKNLLVNPRESSIRYVFDENRQVTDVNVKEYQKSHAVVEEMMLLTNISAAKFLYKNYEKAIYRSNFGFKNNEQESFKTYMESEGINVPDNFETISGYCEIFNDVSKKQELLDVLPVFIQKSQFSIKPNKHFGLGIDKYTYFTSPIRRYADIMVHRLIKDVLLKRDKKEVKESDIQHLNKKRKQLDYISSEVSKRLNVKLMNIYKDKIHEVLIVDINNKGMVVKQKNLGVEGFIPINLFNEFLEFKNKEKILCNKNLLFKLGHYINAKVENIDDTSNTIIFRYVE